jgi:hypothetical protein
VTLTQITIRSIIHDEERDVENDIKIVNADNIRMTQPCNNAGLFAELSPTPLPS